MVFTEEQITGMAKEALPQIKEKLLAQMKDSLADTVSWAMRDVVAKEVKEFMDKELSPALKEHLTQNKPLLLEAAIKTANLIGEELTRVMVEKAKKTLSSSYDVQKIAEILF